MTYRAIFDAKIQGTDAIVVFDFTGQLAYGEVIGNDSIPGGTVTATVHAGTDAAPGDFLTGDATVEGAQVSQTIADGVLGVTYNLKCVATTSLGRSLIQTGFVVVSQSSTSPG